MNSIEIGKSIVKEIRKVQDKHNNVIKEMRCKTIEDVNYRLGHIHGGDEIILQIENLYQLWAEKQNAAIGVSAPQSNNEGESIND